MRTKYSWLSLSVMLFTVCLVSPALKAQPKIQGTQVMKSSRPDSLILSVLARDSVFFAPYLAHAKNYRIQIIYSSIERPTGGSPSVKTYSYGVDTSTYFFPASLIKLPCSALALEKLSGFKVSGLNKESIMHHEAAFRCQYAEKSIDTGRLTRASMGNYIRKMMLVSDNVAYNRTYEFLGPDYIREALTSKGYPSARIIQRFAGCDREANRHTNGVVFLNTHFDTLYKQAPTVSKALVRNPASKPFVGHSHLNAAGELVKEPYNFTYANHLILPDVHQMVVSLMVPEAVPASQRFNLSAEDLAFLKKYMGMYPRESGMGQYADFKNYFDSYKKYLVYGRGQSRCPDSIRIHNIVGMAQGFLADCAYISDPANHTEFFLSALIYANPDGVLNDGLYEYNSTGLPFLKQLGLTFLNYERDRAKKGTEKPK